MCSREAGLTFRLARFTPVTHTRQEAWKGETITLRQGERDVSDSHLVRGLRCRDGVARVARPPRAGAERACGPPGRPGRRAGVARRSTFLLFGMAVQNARDGAAHTLPVAPRTLCEPRHTRTATRADTPAAAQPKRGGGSLPVHRSTAQRRGPEWVRCHVANSVSHFMRPLRGSPPVRASLQAYPSPVASRQASSQQGPSARPSAAARRTAGMSRAK